MVILSSEIIQFLERDVWIFIQILDQFPQSLLAISQNWFRKWRSIELITNIVWAHGNEDLWHTDVSLGSMRWSLLVNIDELLWDSSNSSALAMELQQSCARRPLIWYIVINLSMNTAVHTLLAVVYHINVLPCFYEVSSNRPGPRRVACH